MGDFRGVAVHCLAGPHAPAIAKYLLALGLSPPVQGVVSTFPRYVLMLRTRDW